MINFIKSRGLVFWLSLLAAIFIIIGLIVMLVSNGVNGYAMKNIGIFVVAAVVAILLLAAMEILAIKFGDRPWLIAFTAVIVALICLVLGFVLINRVDVASAVWTWDKGNARRRNGLEYCRYKRCILSACSSFDYSFVIF